MTVPMMTWSVWSYPKKAYEYFTAPYDGKIHAGIPPKARGSSPMGLGVTPEMVAWQLPAGAKKIGEGPTPKGKIASLGAAPDSDSGWDWKMLAGVVVVAYFLTKRGSRQNKRT